MAKNWSSVGAIMEILNISVQELAKHLDIDRTTISKWRTGSRKINPKSPYYPKVAEYFVEKNELLPNRPLDRLFMDTYPDAPRSKKEDMEKLVDRYLQDDKTSSTVRKCMDDLQKALYHTNVAIFKGAEGRKRVLSMLLNMMEGVTPPCTLKIFELDYFEWLNRDVAYMQSCLKQMEMLLKMGHRIELSFATERSSAALKVFVRTLSRLLYTKNLSIYLINQARCAYIMPSFYGIVGRCVSVSVNYAESEKNIHTVLHFDDFTVQKYLGIQDRMVELYADPFHITDEEDDKDKIINLMQFTKDKKEPAYFFGRVLPLATMSRELLDELMEQSHLKQAEKERCLLLYQTLQSALLHSPEGSLGGLYMNMEQIMESSTCDSLIQHELSAFSQKMVVLSGDQFRRHLAETAAFVKENKNVKVWSVQSADYDARVACTWVKRNFWCIALNEMAVLEENQIIYMDEAPLVNMAADLCEERLKQFPMNFKNSGYIAEVLERLSRSEPV